MDSTLKFKTSQFETTADIKQKWISLNDINCFPDQLFSAHLHLDSFSFFRKLTLMLLPLWVAS